MRLTPILRNGLFEWLGRLAGAVAVAAPVMLFFAAPRTGDIWVASWVAAAILGPLVFELITPPRPEWGYGLAFAWAVGVVFGVMGGIFPPFEYSGTGQRVLGAFVFLAGAFLGGMVGASAASLIGRVLVRDEEYPERGPQRLLPWHVGAAVLAVEVVTAAAIAVAMT